MDISNRIRQILLAFSLVLPVLSFNPLIAVAQESDQEEISAQKQMNEDLIELHLKPVLEQYKKVDFILELIAQMVNNNNVRGANKEEALDQIRAIRSELAEMLKKAGMIHDISQIYILNMILQVIVEHSHEIIKNGLKVFPKPDMEKLDTLINRSNPTLQTVQSSTENNAKLIKALETEANRVGLSFYNRIYRRTEKFMVDHKVLPRLFYTTVASVFIMQLIATARDQQIFVSDEQGNPIPKDVLSNPNWIKKIQEYIGQVPYFNRDGQVINPEKLKLLGRTYLYFHDLGVLNFTLPALLGWTMFKDQAIEGAQTASDWSMKKWENIRAYLRGAPVVHQVESWNRDPKARFKDLIGYDHVKSVLWDLVEYIRDHERFDRAGIVPHSGYLLAGKPGTGKTIMAEALAGEIKDALEAKGITEFHYLYFTAAEVIKYGINRIMYIAKDLAPCVVFIDEIDMMGLQRERNGELLSQVLNAMSGAMMNADNTRQVIMLAATNMPENLDHALLRAGRLEKTLWFDYPNTEERALFLIKEFNKRAIMTIDPQYIYKLAQETESVSFEGLKTIINRALLYARADGESLNKMHLERALDEEVRLILFESPALSDEEKRLVATHQAGHAIGTMLLGKSIKVAKVTICPVTTKPKEQPLWERYYTDDKDKQKSGIQYGKTFSIKKNNSTHFSSHADLIAELKIELAGHVAEKIIFGGTGYVYHREDNDRALGIAKYIVFKGLNEKDLPKEKRAKLQQEALELMEKCEAEVMELLVPYKDKLEITADALQKYLTLLGEHLEMILKGEQLPVSADEPSENQESADEEVQAIQEA